MRIGLITLSRIQSNQNKYYNAQDLGLARALVKKGNQVVIYRLTKEDEKTEKEGKIQIIYHKVKGFGKQSLCSFKHLDTKLDRLVCFSDNQISFPTLCKWCERNEVLLQPYIGVLQSNSPQRFVQFITNAMVSRNIKRYRKMTVYGKTPDILQQLSNKKVENIELLPVCLDEELLKKDYEKYDKIALREKHGFRKEDKILFFMGRLEKEKEPIQMIEILEHVRKKDHSIHLLMVGKGELEEEVCRRIKELQLEDCVQRIPQLSNRDVWELYCLSDCFVNLNGHEIYGMSILESLYYRCVVIAMKAPGPDFILNHGEAGFLCQEVTELENAILSLKETCRFGDTRKYLRERLSWEKISDKLVKEGSHG